MFRNWTIQEALAPGSKTGRTFEMICLGSTYYNRGSPEKQMFYDTSTRSSGWFNFPFNAVAGVVKTLAKATDFLRKNKLFIPNKFWQNSYDVCFDDNCPYAQVKNYYKPYKPRGPIITNKTSHVLNLTGPIVCQIWFDVCVVEVMEDTISWMEPYKQKDKPVWPKLSENSDCIRHETFVKVVNFRKPPDRPLMIIKCSHNCRSGNQYINWETDAFDFTIFTFKAVTRPELLTSVIWRWNGKEMPEDNVFMKANDLSVLFFYPHAFDHLVDEYSMTNVTIYGE